MVTLRASRLALTPSPLKASARQPDFPPGPPSGRSTHALVSLRTRWILAVWSLPFSPSCPSARARRFCSSPRRHSSCPVSPPASARAHDRASWSTMAGASSPWPARTVWRLPVTSGWVSSWYVRLRTALGAIVGSCVGGVRGLWRACGVSVACPWSDGAESRAFFLAGSSRHSALMYWLGFVCPFSRACTAMRFWLFFPLVPPLFSRPPF